MALIAGAWACDSLVDPTKAGSGTNDNSSGTDNPNTPPGRSKVSGALVVVDGGVALPANVHVALVWRTKDGLTTGDDTPVVDGRFNFDVTDPSPETLLAANDVPPTFYGGDDASIGTKSLHPRTNVGGSVGSSMLVGYAGFVVYADTNGNGRLDFDAPDRATDEILGGNRALTLVYLKDASAYELETLRIAGTTAVNGYNLSWNAGTTAKDARWFGLDLAQLYLTPTGLPTDVCAYTPTYGGVYDKADGGTRVTCAPTGEYFTTEICTALVPLGSALCTDSTRPPFSNWCAEGELKSIYMYPAIPADWPCVLRVRPEYDGGADDPDGSPAEAGPPFDGSDGGGVVDAAAP